MTTNTTSTLQEYGSLPLPKTKAELLERMAVAYDAAEALIAAYDEAALTKSLSESGWSAKDYIAHVRDWENGLVAILQKKVRHEEMGLDPALIAAGDYDAENDVLYQKHKNRPLSDVLADFRATHQALLDMLAKLDDEDLQKPYTYYQPNVEEIIAGDDVNQPVMGWLAGDTYSHYAEHVLDVGRLLQNSD
ncbi:MAG: ClbS/DfsB family four-helix bundle protein [Candidatus Promineifilaceae bacterium]